MSVLDVAKKHCPEVLDVLERTKAKWEPFKKITVSDIDYELILSKLKATGTVLVQF